MKIFLKTEDEIELMRNANRLVGKTLGTIGKHIGPGVTTLQLDKIAEEFIRDNGAVPTFKGFPNPFGKPFPASICTSVNDVIVHGIPDDTVLAEGDIVSVDVGVQYKGVHTDACRTYPVGKISDEAKQLIEVTKQSFFEAIKGLKAGSYVGDIGEAVQKFVEPKGYSLVREMQGHGIGLSVHEDPGIPNYGVAGTGYRLRENMAICIEPMVNMGSRHIKISSTDGWTCRTRDGKWAAHYENTLLITKTGVEIMTLEED